MFTRVRTVKSYGLFCLRRNHAHGVFLGLSSVYCVSGFVSRLASPCVLVSGSATPCSPRSVPVQRQFLVFRVSGEESLRPVVGSLQVKFCFFKREEETCVLFPTACRSFQPSYHEHCQDSDHTTHCYQFWDVHFSPPIAIISVLTSV